MCVGVITSLASFCAQGQLISHVQTIFDDEADGIVNENAVTVSPDGFHVYSVRPNDNTLLVFSRDVTTGALTSVESHVDGARGVDGLGGAYHVVVSPDGDHVYAAGLADNAIAAFSRNALTGALTFVEVQFDGLNGVDGLEGAFHVALSPDGDHVYATGLLESAVAVFGRDAMTGSLTFVEAQFDDENGVEGLRLAISTVVSPDGTNVYAVSSFDGAVSVFNRDASTGALAFVEAQFDDEDNVTGLLGAWTAAVSPDGAHVYVTGAESNALAVFSRDASTGALTFVEAQVDGVGAVDGLDGAISVAVAGDGDHVYVTGAFDDAIAVFSRDGATGALTFLEAQFDGVGGVDGLDEAFSLALSTDGAHVYVTGARDNALAVFSRNNTFGGLTFVEAQFDGPSSADGLADVQSIAVAPDGSYVYAASFIDDALVVFRRDVATGELALVEVIRDGIGGVDGLDGARSVAIAPGGDHVYAVGGDDNALAVFRRDSATGTLTFIEVARDGVNGVDGLRFAISVAVAPDGAHVYAAGIDDNALAVFSRDATSGKLTFVEVIRDGSNGVNGLGGVWHLALSPDGANLYAASSDDDALAVFERDVVTGALTFVEMVRDGSNGVNGLNGAVSVAVSPDGAHVYAAGFQDAALAVFSRDSETGALIFIEMIRDGENSVDGLDGASAVVVSPDGSHVCATSARDNAVLVFRRDATTGALTFAEVQFDGENGADGLAGSVSVAVSPDGGHLYIASFADDAITVFAKGKTDINGDTMINAVDVQLVINAALGLAIAPFNGDINQDESVNAIDVQLVINTVLGIT
jgi:6-phosphogluconolactonase (cycloisomerase 2 family)